MGKTTLYHPIPLSVIRGAAEYCGWKFGKIKQISAAPLSEEAHYRAEIVLIPHRVVFQPTELMLNDLQECFNVDIHARWLRNTRAGAFWMVDLFVNASKDEPRA